MLIFNVLFKSLPQARTYSHLLQKYPSLLFFILIGSTKIFKLMIIGDIQLRTWLFVADISANLAF